MIQMTIMLRKLLLLRIVIGNTQGFNKVLVMAAVTRKIEIEELAVMIYRQQMCQYTFLLISMEK